MNTGDRTRLGFAGRLGSTHPHFDGAAGLAVDRLAECVRIVGDVRGRQGFAKRTIVRSATLLILCGAVVVGILGMHSFVMSESHASTTHHSSMKVADSADPHMALGHEVPASGETSSSDTLAAACGGAMLACLTILVAFGAYLLLRHVGRCRVLWTRPRPFVLRLGDVQRALQAMAPRQRSCVIRC